MWKMNNDIIKSILWAEIEISCTYLRTYHLGGKYVKRSVHIKKFSFNYIIY